jgi:hypothetical protein
VTASYAEDMALASTLLATATTDPAATSSATADQPASSAPTTDAAAPADGSGTPAPTDATAAPGATTPAESPAPTAAGGTPTDGTTTPADTATPTPGDTGGAAATTTPTGSPAPTDTATAAPTDPTSAAPTDTGTPTPTDTTATTTPAESPTPTGSDTASPSASATPTDSATPTATPTTSASPSPTPTSTTPTQTWLQGFPVNPKLVVRGMGFDTCAAPSLRSMYAWRPSVMNAIGIYVGGINRACPDGNLSASWVKTVRSWGYSFIPTYVGRQPPCTNRSWAKIDTRSGYAYAQGAAAGDDAVAKMRKFGFGRGNPVYLDIEYYSGDLTCTKAVRTFTIAFVRHLHAAGYVAGFYSTAASGVRDIAAFYGPTSYRDLPDALWFARWNNLANLDAKPYVADNLWPARRIKQYTGGHLVRINGVTINIDSDYLYGPVALPGSH